MVEKEKAEFFKAGSSQESDKEPSETPHTQDIVHELSENGINPEASKPPSQEHTEPLSKLAASSFLL